MKKERTTLPVALLQLNEGQLEWMPKNPRQWTQDGVNKAKDSLERDPDFLDDRPLLVVPHDGAFVVYAGNMRLTAARELGVEALPCVSYEPESVEDRDTIKRRAILDNGDFGAWDWDALANEWDDLPLGDWGVPAWPSIEAKGSGDDGEDVPAKEKVEAVEALLNEAMRENVRETLQQMEVTMKRGWIATFFTKGLAQAKFIRAKYYGEHYPQWVSLYFCPERFATSANKRSLLDLMKDISKGADAGIAGFRSKSEDGLLLQILQVGNYPFASARIPMDFPANKARELIVEFCDNEGRGAAILDPCHGWGGRLTGAMMADVGLYVGVDPSTDAHNGLDKIAEAFAPYCEGTRVETILAPFEDAKLGDRLFDFALTSPPYFDVEQYKGEGQSHIRYNTYKKWRDGFYRPLIEKTYQSLKDGAVFCLQVGSQSYPLLEDGKEIAEKIGFVVEEIRPLGGGTTDGINGRGEDDEGNEKIIILRK